MLTFVSNDYLKKITLIISLFIIHNFILAHIIGFDISFFIIIILSLFITFYLNKSNIVDNITNKYILLYSAYYISLFIFLIYLIPTNIKDILDNIFLFGMREELFFRYFMVGILINPITDINRKGIIQILFTLIITNIVFMVNHLYYSPILMLFIFTLGGFFSIIYLFCGLVPAIITHATHNLYFKNEYSILIHLLLIIPIIVSPHLKKLIHEFTNQ